MKNSVFSPAHWDEQFHHKMVDNRGFLVHRSYTVSVPMMHRTGEVMVKADMILKHKTQW